MYNQPNKNMSNQGRACTVWFIYCEDTVFHTVHSEAALGFRMLSMMWSVWSKCSSLSTRSSCGIDCGGLVGRDWLAYRHGQRVNSQTVKSWENLTSIACTFAHLTILQPLYFGKSKKSHLQQYYSYILQIIYIISEENKLLPPYPPHLKNVTTLPCKMHNVFIWLKLCCIPPNVGGSEKKPVVGWHWWLWKELVVMCGNWNVRQAALQQMFKVTTFCTDTW